METLLNRYRNLSVLLLLVVGQLLLLAWQVRAGDDARLLRVWAVTAVTPLARGIEWVRGGTGGFFSEYVLLRDVRRENAALKEEVGQLRLANRFLKTELEMAERARALALFRDRTPSKVLAARVIGTSAGLNSRVVFVDRGTTDGIRKGMAVLVPEGIVGKVVQAYPTASQVMLATSQGFAAGVISQKHRVRGTLKGLGSSLCPVEYIENEDKVEAGEWFYTSGDDRIFPRGLPVGIVKTVREGRGGKEVTLEPSGLRGGVDEVLIVVEGVHGLVPDPPRPSSNEVQILPPPPDDTSAEEDLNPASRALTTEADRLRERYRRMGDSQGHNFGANPGRPPDFNRPLPASPKPAAPKPQDPPPAEVQP
jgi:rod shape-determining protein MreC